ncbi:MAG: DivIVA domain-containing protein [Firmicutes bacterium]|uniref:DivIVA domain-containing protein n=1 Tax=Candidatus Onthovivens merdipullorum TaxID=2840889 RepID=A0A9D9DGR4_9BACL|nr:DivIVA domain-containing protein [Candidatus Onthovivens merdipullorum]
MKLQLSSKDILNKTFKKNTKGYDPNEVDSFLDKILSDYRMIDGVMKGLESQIDQLKKDNQNLRVELSKKDAELSGNHNQFLANPDIVRLDNLDLLKKISKYEKKFYQMGVDPSKIK